MKKSPTKKKPLNNCCILLTPKQYLSTGRPSRLPTRKMLCPDTSVQQHNLFSPPLFQLAACLPVPLRTPQPRQCGLERSDFPSTTYLTPRAVAVPQLGSPQLPCSSCALPSQPFAPLCCPNCSLPYVEAQYL